MRALELLLLPVAALAALGLAGAWPAVVLGRGLPDDARGALAPLFGAAALACLSPLVPLGIPVWVAGAGALVPLAALACSRLTEVRAALRAAWRAYAVAVVGLLLVALPSLARGSWAVSSYGNGDLYFWTSQARAFLDGPAGPAHPDRIAFERITDQGWAVALPVWDALLSLLHGSGPADVYGALAALLGIGVPLAGYVCARMCFEWNPRRAAITGGLLALNANVLFAAHYGWHGQIAGAAFATCALAFLRLALDPGAPTRHAAAAGLLAAAALSSYRMPIAPYLAVAALAVVGAWFVRRRSLGLPANGAGRALLGSAAAAAVFGIGSVVPLAYGLSSFLDHQLLDTGWLPLSRAPVGQALGLVPPSLDSADAVPAALGVTLAAAVGALVIVGVAIAFRERLPRADLLAAGAVVGLGGTLVLSLPSFSPYLGLKLLGYAAPFLTIAALVPLLGRRSLALTAAGAAGLALVVATTAVTAQRAVRYTSTPGALAGLAEIAPRLPAEAVVSVEIEETWWQAWAVYYLRDVRLTVPRPSEVFVGTGLDRSSAGTAMKADHRLGAPTDGDPVWAWSGLRLERVG